MELHLDLFQTNFDEYCYAACKQLNTGPLGGFRLARIVLSTSHLGELNWLVKYLDHGILLLSNLFLPLIELKILSI